MTFLGKHHSAEFKAKLSERMKGNKLGSRQQSAEERAKKSAKLKGRIISEEHKKKIGIALSGRKRPDFGLTQLGEKNPNWKGDTATKVAGRARARRWYPCPTGKERHHIDGNPLNNAPENIEFVTRKEHMTVDGRLEIFTQCEPIKPK